MDLVNSCIIGNTEEAMKLIMNNNINLDIVDYNGRTALLWACQNKMEEVALELIKTGHAKPDHISKDGKTALSWACERGMKEEAYELVAIGAFTINDLLFLKPEWVPEEFLIMSPVNVTEVDILKN